MERLGLLLALSLGFAARAAAFALSVEHYGDAPVRVELAERWARAPHLWRGFSEAYQYGPLHLTLLGAALRIWPDRFVAPRAVSFACGMACIALLWKITRDLFGAGAALFAACALSLSSLHIQASASSASEVVFLAFFLAALERLLAAREARAGSAGAVSTAVSAGAGSTSAGRGALFASALLLGAAGLFRYDGWLYVPLFCALLLLDWRRGERALADVAGYGALAALPALLWLAQNARFGDALAPLHYIDRDHRALAQAAIGWYGQAGYRLYCLAFWPGAILLLCSPVAGAFAFFGAVRALARRSRGWELAALAFVPALYLTFRGAVLADFRPLTRFAMVAATLSLPFAYRALESFRASFGATAGRVALAASALLMLATPAALASFSYGRNGSAAEWARPLSPISSVPPGIAQAARFLREHAGPTDVVLLDGVWDYLDIPLAFESGLPDRQLIRRAWPDFEERLSRASPTMAVLLYQGNLRSTKGAEGAIETADRFDFRGIAFCAEAHFVYASIYRRCGAAGAER
jgi:4-amino-4-deoxy-L-arabinose transferase-like glycosyltransferase